ncbi:hypothetical protein O2W14_13020 [Modestobacter sp. VKM Ac-2986]|uniref:hypothetical protein n=1 Tax=Modestobacter sp. VKM Ac-2986 TaxID=3004140 RepID=UPI0022AB6809|nr:hypothetical protein [Modestobacter sp. VKM Ac-2986]MCZ2829757.1 hypothetical protein [Modestobacter sp. VKM Ac-2986]
MFQVAERRRAQLRELAASYGRSPDIRSVAVVGNKPMDPSPERARAVDDCDLVVRVNGFRVDDEGDAPTYGRRADVIFFNRALRATPWFFTGYRERLHLLVEPGRLHWEPDSIPSWWPQDLGQVHMDNDDLTIPLSVDMGLDSVAQGLWATTGTMAAWWARTTFPDATLQVVGYSFLDAPEQTRWDHSSGDDCLVGPEHRLALESALFHGWVSDGRTTIWP